MTSSRIALGTVQFGLSYGIANSSGKVPDAEAARILDDAARLGIDTLDTAIAYGDSESVLGAAGVSRFRIVTKLPAVPDNCIDIEHWAREHMRQSLQRLRVDSVDAVLLHRPDQLLMSGGEQLYGALQNLKSSGLTRNIGVSIYAAQELDLLCRHFDLDLVQAPFNILDSRLLLSGWLDMLHQRGIELHTRSVFLQGLLLMPTDVRPAAFQRWQPIWSEWDRWLKEVGLTPLQACLRYILSFKKIDRVVVGIDNIEQLRQIVSVSDTDLPSLPCWPGNMDADLLNPANWKHA